MKKLTRFIVISVICFLPSELCLISKYLCEPHGFWQNLFLIGPGIYFTGCSQYLLFAVWIALIFIFWFPKKIFP